MNRIGVPESEHKELVAYLKKRTDMRTVAS